MAFGIIRKIAEATATLAGLMSASDKAKIDTVEVNATHTDPVVDNLLSESTTAPLSANQGRVLKGLIDGSGIVQTTLTSNGLTLSVVKYGRVCMVSLNFGEPTATIAAGNPIFTLPAEFRPATWVPVPDQNPSFDRYFAVNGSGAVTSNVNMTPGIYPRFSTAYITLM